MKKALVILGLAVTQFSYSQQTRFAKDPQEALNQAREYFQKEQYSLAYPLLKDLQLQLRETDRSNQALNVQEVRYYTTVCALKQNEELAMETAKEFIDRGDNVARVQMMNFHLAEYYFRKEDYTNAIAAYEQVSLDNLNNSEVADLKFHQGYSYFTNRQFNLASPLLNTIRQSPGDQNYQDANYYYGFISFYDKNYKDALESFTVVQDHEAYGKIVPYYIATINYSNNEKDKALTYVESRLKTGNQFYDSELRQLVGHAYFEKQQYEKALPYLESYVSKSDKVKREDLYELSYSYYKTGNLPKAIEGFKQLGGKEDSLSQNAMYLLGDAYLKTGEKANARNAFLFCAANSSNETQREISMFNYAKLSYELNFQDIALAELQKFAETYPSSTYITEARELLVSVLANTNNYKEALSMIEALPSPTAATRALLPKIYYGRATELANDGLLVTANELLTKAEKHPNNASVLPFVQFWKGEIAYRLNQIDVAIPYYFEYLKSGATNGEVSPINARYNLGYAYLKKENYRQALGFFEQVVSNPRINSQLIEQDAYLRSADCYYMNRDYKRAGAMYDKVLDYSWPSSDYAMFQKGMIAGVTSSKEKVSLLSSLNRKFPSSSLIPDANMEIANTLLSNEQFREAISYLKNVVADPNSALKPRAHLRLGIAYFNLNNNQEALAQYTTLLKQYPNSVEAEEGIENARAIFVEEGRSGEYVNFARSMGQEITANEEDQLAYEEAEVQFSNGNFSAAAKKFEDYLAKFPEGTNSIDALYYKSEIYLNQKNWAKAAAGYEILADRVPHKFGEKSLTQAARLNYFDLKDYNKSEKYFLKLKDFASGQESKMEAMRGLLRSQFQLQKWNEAVPNAKELLEQKSAGTDDKVLGNMVIARSYQAGNQCDLAISTYRTVAGLSKAAYGAEARYEIANCYFSMNRMKDAETAAFDVISKAGSYEDWVTKAYILLGDVYTRQKDYFNAKATYQSVIDNAKIETLRQEAERKLKEVTEEERKNSRIEG